MLVDSLGQVVSRRDFMPFGEEITPDGTHRNADLKYNFGDNIRQKFTGYQKDEETQLDFAEARMYQNLHGRFTAVDPLLASGKSANPQTFNRYVYVINNPIILVDPDGLQVASSVGRVYQRDEYEFQIFGDDDVIPDGFKPFDGNVTYTANDGFVYNVFANGFDNLGLSLTGSIQRSAASQLTQDQNLEFLRGAALRANNANDGISTGTSNFLRGSFNLVTQPGGIIGGFAGIPNPLALERVPYQNPQTAAYGFLTEVFWIAGSGAATGGGAASGLSRASSLSVVPKSTNVLIDSSVTTRLGNNPSLGGLIGRNETPLVSYVTRPELRNAVSTGNMRGVPRALDNVGVFGAQPSLNLRINIRGSLPPGRGNFGDGIIGAQAVQNNLPLITADRNLANVVTTFGGRVRYFH